MTYICGEISQSIDQALRRKSPNQIIYINNSLPDLLLSKTRDVSESLLRSIDYHRVRDLRDLVELVRRPEVHTKDVIIENFHSIVQTSNITSLNEKNQMITNVFKYCSSITVLDTKRNSMVAQLCDDHVM